MIAKMTRPLTGLALAAAVLLLVLYGETIRQAIMVIGFTLAGLLALGTLFGAFFGAWYLAERIRMIRACRIEAEKNAHVMIVQNGDQIHIRETDPAAVWKAAHLQRSLYSNGHYEKPAPDEDRAWEMFIASKGRRALGDGRPVIDGELLPPAPPVNLLDELDKTQRCLIVAPSGGGKTTLLKHVVNRRLSQSQIVVIDPHSYPQKWPGCDVVGVGRDYREIEYTLAALVNLMTQRYQEIGRGDAQEESHPRLTVIIDEWRAIVMNTTNASETITALLTESRKAAFSIFVATHSERVKALGIEGEGDLRDGFLMVRLGWEHGQQIATIDRGNGETPAVLPGDFNGYAMPGTLPEKPFTIPQGPQPDETESQVLDLAAQGESLSAIAKEVYGSKGGKQVNLIKQILTKFDQ